MTTTTATTDSRINTKDSRIAGHSKTDLKEDAALFGEWVTDGAWFYDSTESSFYRMNVDQKPFTFTLEPATGTYRVLSAGVDAKLSD